MSMLFNFVAGVAGLASKDRALNHMGAHCLWHVARHLIWKRR